MKVVYCEVNSCEDCPYFTMSIYYMHCRHENNKRIVREGNKFPDWCPLPNGHSCATDWLMHEELEDTA